MLTIAPRMPAATIAFAARWQPHWLHRQGPLGERSQVVLQYSFGHVADGEFPGGSLRFQQLTAGGSHTCGLTEAGRAWCWGRNGFGQLGDGSTRDSPVPMPVRGELRFARLSGGGAHTCGESRSGDLYCWGNNIQGQLGDGTRENRMFPVRSVGP